jgi:hypothetical protein
MMRLTFANYVMPSASLPSLVIILEIDLQLSERSHGMLRQSDRSFQWAISKTDATCFHDLVVALVESGIPAGHQYLECNVAGEVPVIVSRGEYPADWRSE